MGGLEAPLEQSYVSGGAVGQPSQGLLAEAARSAPVLQGRAAAAVIVCVNGHPSIIRSSAGL